MKIRENLLYVIIFSADRVVEVHENLVTRLPVSVENDSVVIREKSIVLFYMQRDARVEFKIKTVEHLNQSGYIGEY